MTADCAGHTASSQITVILPPVIAVLLAPQIFAIIQVGLTLQVEVTVLGSMGTVLLDRDVVWASDDPAIATVDQSGLITAVAEGDTRIRASVEGVSSSLRLSVQALPPAVYWIQLSVGEESTCGVTNVGAYCWGEFSGFVSSLMETPVAFAQISVGEDHACALSIAGAAFCWGRNRGGELGTGSDASSDVPAPVSGGLTFKSVSAGAGLTCGVTVVRAAYCWGGNLLGELGDGSMTASNVPVRVAGNLVFQAVSASFLHACGITIDGEAYCWGLNLFGELGDGSQVDRRTPVRVSGSLRFTKISSFGGHTCGITVDGRAYCWGLNSFGQLGATSTSTCDGRPCNTVPVAVAGDLRFGDLQAGFLHTCAVAVDGAAFCWGSNLRGQLGDGSIIDRTAPTRVAGGLAWISVAAGFEHSCGVTTDGAAFCWGGHLPGTTFGSTVPVRVLDPV